MADPKKQAERITDIINFSPEEEKSRTKELTQIALSDPKVVGVIKDFSDSFVVYDKLSTDYAMRDESYLEAGSKPQQQVYASSVKAENAMNKILSDKIRSDKELLKKVRMTAFPDSVPQGDPNFLNMALVKELSDEQRKLIMNKLSPEELKTFDTFQPREQDSILAEKIRADKPLLEKIRAKSIPESVPVEQAEIANRKLVIGMDPNDRVAMVAKFVPKEISEPGTPKYRSGKDPIYLEFQKAYDRKAALREGKEMKQIIAKSLAGEKFDSDEERDQAVEAVFDKIQKTAYKVVDDEKFKTKFIEITEPAVEKGGMSGLVEKGGLTGVVMSGPQALEGKLLPVLTDYQAAGVTGTAKPPIAATKSK